MGKAKRQVFVGTYLPLNLLNARYLRIVTIVGKYVMFIINNYMEILHCLLRKKKHKKLIQNYVSETRSVAILRVKILFTTKSFRRDRQG